MWINRDSCSCHFHFSFLPFHSAPSILCSPSLLSSQPPYLYFLLLSVEQFLLYSAWKKRFLHWINTLQRSLLQASAAQHQEHLLAQVMVRKSVLNTHDRDAVASARGTGAAGPFAAALPGLSRRRGPLLPRRAPGSPVPSREQDAATARCYQACACKTATSRNRSSSCYPKTDIICTYYYSGPCLNPAAT